MKNKITSIEILRIIAIIFVISIHISAPVFRMYKEIPNQWMIANIINAISRPAVPIFLMISGGLLLNPQKNESIKNFLQKRFLKILIPTIFWTIFFFFFSKPIAFNAIDLKVLETILKTIIQGDVHYHLQFMYYLIGLYLLTPILRVYLRNADKSNIYYFLALWLIANPLVGILNYFFGLKIGIQLYFFTGMVGYYILGYLLFQTEISPKLKKTMIIAGIVGMLITIVGTYLLTYPKLIADTFFYGYLNLNVIFNSIAIVIIVTNLSWDKFKLKNEVWNNLILKISKTTFGVYLVHPLVIEILKWNNISGLTINTLIGIPLSVLLVFIISTCLVMFLQKIPVLKYIVP